MRILDNDDVAALLPLEDIAGIVETALGAEGRGEAISRPRTNLAVPVNPAENLEYVLKTWDAALPASELAGTRLTSGVLATAREGERIVGAARAPAGGHTGFIFVFSATTGEAIALVHDAHLARAASSACAALAVKYLAREDAAVLAMFGAGRQARQLVPMIASVRKLREVRVFHPAKDAREAFARELDTLGIAAHAAADPRLALEGASIVSTASSSPFHLFEAEWLAEGAHVSLSRPSEAPAALFARAAVLVTAGAERATTLAIGGAGDIWTQRDVAPPAVDPARVLPLASAIARDPPLRTSPSAISVYGALSGQLPASIFIALAGAAAARAEDLGRGHQIPREWLLQGQVS